MSKRKSSALGSLFASYGSDEDEEDQAEEEEEDEGSGKFVGIVAYGGEPDGSTPVSGEMVEPEDDEGSGLNLQNVAPSPSSGGQTRPQGPQGPLLPSGVELSVGTAPPVEEESPPLLTFGRRMFSQVEIPPQPQGEVDQDLQAKIEKYYLLKANGRVISTELRKSKAYRNPDFLQKIVEHFDIDELSSHFSSEVFDPKGYPKEDYFDQLAEQLRKYYDKRQAAKREFVSAGTQGGNTKPAGPTITRVEGLKPGGGSTGSLGQASAPKVRKWDT